MTRVVFSWPSRPVVPGSGGSRGAPEDVGPIRGVLLDWPGPVLHEWHGGVSLFLREHPSVPASVYRVEHPSDATKVLGGLCSVIELGDMTPGPHLGEELLAGKEPVHQEMQCLVQPVQEINLSLTVMPVIPHELPDDRVVLLFHMGIVILVVRTGPDNAPRLEEHLASWTKGLGGEGDPPGMTEAEQVAGRGPRSRCPHAGRGLSPGT